MPDMLAPKETGKEGIILSAPTKALEDPLRMLTKDNTPPRKPLPSAPLDSSTKRELLKSPEEGPAAKRRSLSQLSDTRTPGQKTRDTRLSRDPKSYETPIRKRVEEEAKRAEEDPTFKTGIKKMVEGVNRAKEENPFFYEESGAKAWQTKLQNNPEARAEWQKRQEIKAKRVRSIEQRNPTSVAEQNRIINLSVGGKRKAWMDTTPTPRTEAPSSSSKSSGASESATKPPEASQDTQ